MIKTYNKRGFVDKEVYNIRLVFGVLSFFSLLSAYMVFPSVFSYLLVLAFMLGCFFILFYPLRLRPLFKIWMKTVSLLGNFNTQVLLLLIFFFMIIPTGIIMRLAGKDPMNRSKRTLETYWLQYTIEGLKDKKRYERQF